MVDRLSAKSRSTELTTNAPIAPTEQPSAKERQLPARAHYLQFRRVTRTSKYTIPDLKESTLEARGKEKTIWLNIIGEPEQTTIDEIKALFQIGHFDPLDLAKAHQRSKFEWYEDQMAIVVWSVDINSASHPHQIVIMLSEKCLLTFQYDGRDLLADIKEKLNKGVNKSRPAELIIWHIQFSMMS